MGPTMDSAQCKTCSAAADSQHRVTMAITWLVVLSGISMIATAGCEAVELKLHNAAFSIAILVLDFLCGILLVIAFFVCLTGALRANASCDPTQHIAALKQAG